jgi:hypothetical protein
MARVTAEEYAEKWGRRLKGAATDITRGVERVSVAPGKAAAAAQQLMLDRLTASILDGTWAARVGAVSLEDWKKALLEKGVGRIASGVDAAGPKQIAMAQKLLAAVDAAVAKVKAMPKGDIEQSIARMTTFTREMNKAKIRRQS